MQTYQSLFGLCVMAATCHVSAITLDGKLNENEWQKAKVYDQFIQSFPNTGELPNYKTTTLLYTDEQGIYIGFINEQVDKSRRYSGHDQYTSADFNMVFIDFDGDGNTAYEFVATLGGGTMDGIYSRGNNSNRDWDGPWQVAVTEDEGHWYSEFFIPWTIATYAESPTALRQISVYFQRNNVVASEQYSFPDTHRGKKRFTYEFSPLAVPSIEKSSAYVDPYVSQTIDYLTDNKDTRLGADFGWNPTSNQQVIATLNPDFGQVESDELVVNFSAIETLRTDKRSFFTENQSLFDIRGPENLRLLNTRRMGGTSELDPNQTHDIGAAVKYIYNAGNVNYGLLAVKEKDAGLAQGKQFVSGRWFHAGDEISVGQLINYVDKGDGASSWVTNVDSQWRLTDTMSLSSNIMASKLSGDMSSDTGFGTTLVASYVPVRHWQNNLTLMYFDDKLQVNDAGYMARNALQQVQADSQFDDYRFAKDSIVSRTRFYGRFTYSENKAGDVLNQSAYGSAYLRLKSKHGFRVSMDYAAAVIDDLISWGHGNLALSSRKSFALYYESPSPADVSFDATASILQEGIDGWARKFNVNSKIYFGNPVRLDLAATYLSSDDWLYGSTNGTVGQYRRELRQLNAKLVAKVIDDMDFSLIVQWFGLKAEAIAGVKLGAESCCEYTDEKPIDFSTSRLSLQARLSYRFNQQSSVYLVAGRGGSYFDSTTDSEFSDLISNAHDNPFQHFLTAKMSYQF